MVNALHCLILRYPSHRHHVFLLTFDGKLFLAPLHNPRRALDVGSDLSPIQSPVAPANLRFEIDDCCSAWGLSGEPFRLHRYPYAIRQRCGLANAVPRVLHVHVPFPPLPFE